MDMFNFFQNNNSVKNSNGKKLDIDKARCPQNHSCPAVRACPVDALLQKGFAAPEVDHNKCIKCGKCAKVCPMGALSF